MIYEFKCNKCCIIIEESLPISSNKEITTCKKCGGEAKRMISKSSFILKGKGWAKDGYSKEK